MNDGGHGQVSTIIPSIGLACIYNKLRFNFVIITQTNNYLQPNQIAEIGQNEKLQNWGRKFRKIWLRSVTQKQERENC